MKVQVLIAQSCLTLFKPTECSQSGSSVYGIFQARILEWVAFPFSRESSRPRAQTQVSCIAGRFFTIWATYTSIDLWMGFKEKFVKSQTGWPLGLQWHVKLELSDCHPALTGSWVSESSMKTSIRRSLSLIKPVEQLYVWHQGEAENKIKQSILTSIQKSRYPRRLLHRF